MLTGCSIRRRAAGCADDGRQGASEDAKGPDHAGGVLVKHLLAKNISASFNQKMFRAPREVFILLSYSAPYILQDGGSLKIS
jgi:hypothetical protein